MRYSIKELFCFLVCLGGCLYFSHTLEDTGFDAFGGIKADGFLSHQDKVAPTKISSSISIFHVLIGASEFHAT